MNDPACERRSDQKPALVGRVRQDNLPVHNLPVLRSWKRFCNAKMMKKARISHRATAACRRPAKSARTIPMITASAQQTIFAVFPADPGYPPTLAILGNAHTARTPTPAAAIAILNASGSVARSGSARADGNRAGSSRVICCLRKRLHTGI